MSRKSRFQCRNSGLAGFKRAFEDIRKEESASLEFAQNCFRRLSFRGDSRGVKQPAGFALKFSRIQEILVGPGRNTSKEQRAYMHGTEARRPFQTLKPPCNVFRRGGLSAAVASKGSHRYRM